MRHTLRFLPLSLFIAFLIHYPCFAGDIRRTIDFMNVRGVTADDPMLGKKFSQKEAFYSIRPPAGWKQRPAGKGAKALQYAARFEDPKTGDFLTIGLLEGGPRDLTIESLSRFRGDYLGTIRKSGLGRIIGSDLFRFNQYHCLQVLAQNKDTIVLQLLVFDQPGSFLQLAFSVSPNRYHLLARALEGSIASLEWPSL